MRWLVASMVYVALVWPLAAQTLDQTYSFIRDKIESCPFTDDHLTNDHLYKVSTHYAPSVLLDKGVLTITNLIKATVNRAMTPGTDGPLGTVVSEYRFSIPLAKLLYVGPGRLDAVFFRCATGSCINNVSRIFSVDKTQPDITEAALLKATSLSEHSSEIEAYGVPLCNGLADRVRIAVNRLIAFSGGRREPF
jgi:hypothetical protein